MRVVIVEDSAVLAEGLNLLLSTSGFEVVATVDEAAPFLKIVEEGGTDAAVVDVRLPPTFRDEGVQAALAARRLVPGLPVLVFSQYVEQVYARELLSDGRGGVGYLLKDRVSRVGDFIDALKRVAAGGTAIDPDVIGQLLVRRDSPLTRLTAREREVLEHMAQGLSNAEIAEKLVVTERAVHKHIGNIFAKLDLDPGDSGHRRVRAVLTYLDA
ncbi:LuxR C-terminal-related transcriptional regulator [Streptomonospora nanhaiensis]|uniref:LuxR C-terminal-related transcriptional regulator n=1 Tax=Streptomonospora nanhaiensis TaxID=1323731 RepID=UPI0015C9869F|nr:response regulator transcription factor [Streptomonospora nanhaiensis]MBV2365198.1 response regulator transcription factor [Streptomonospora nanhaiensis]MBX9387409.1 response regulator transcription factor [Streptomonospora nanhaiensis]